MSKPIYLDFPSASACVKRISAEIPVMRDSAAKISAAMNDLPNHWRGEASDKAQYTYDEQYRTLLTKTVPDAVESFGQFMDHCMQQLIEIDRMLAGK
ncbi:MAG: hypothetical protein FWB96_06150 [Defluviitaleaceae bacterium]|nr:hypothetical protein [Defluviitaleaceae bacterium]MCL2262415.1 hypothetical protein [Defluviitaleaceae bacterium]